jgi:large conductance mechanosensitive channel
MIKEFREFIMRGNVLDLAVGIIIGAAFTAIVGSLVDDIIMPPIGVILGGVDFSNIYTVLREGDPAGPYASLQAAKDAGAAVIAWGVFVNAIIKFLIVALAVFLLVKAVNRMMRFRKVEEKAEEAAKPDPQEKLIAAMDRLTATLERKV